MPDPSVTIFLPSLVGGGAERCMQIVANGLAGRGIPVTLVLGKAEGPFVNDVHDRVHILDLRTSVSGALPGLVRHLRGSRPAALLSAMSHANVVAALAHRAAGAHSRLVVSEHAHLSSVLGEFPGLRMRATYALMYMTYRWADCVVAVSDGVAHDLVQRIPVSPQRVTTIYNPAVDHRLRSLAEAPPAHPWLASDPVPVILGAGRLIAQKDFATLIEAFARVRRRRSVRLMILGEGELRDALQEQASRLGVAEDVALVGFQTNPFSAMRAADVFVLSSRFEGLGCVLIEAMACGTRVVSTDCPSGPREILEGGKWGALVPVGDAARLAAAIEAALDHPAPPDVRARAEAFSDEQALQRYAEVLGLP